MEDDEVFGEHVGSDLRIVLVAAGGAVQELLLLVYHVQALLADRVSAVKVTRGLFLGVVEVVAHGAFHCQSIYYKGAQGERRGGKEGRGDIVTVYTKREGLITNYPWEGRHKRSK